MLIVLNDNKMSISRTVGSLARYLSRIRMAPLYTGVKKELQNLVSRLPIIGEKMDKNIGDLIKTLKNTLVPGQLFEEFGCKYYGPIDGHDLSILTDTLNDLKDYNGLCMLHILTEKGKGYEYAAEDPESFHGVSPGTGLLEGRNGKIRLKPHKSSGSKTETYTSLFSKKLVQVAGEDKRVVAITAAMPDGTGLKRFAEAYPDRYFDVGITEQHAAGFAGGLSFSGAKPVVAIYSTFMQRCYDQVFQEICLQNSDVLQICLQNSDVLLAMDRGGLVGQDGPTHHGLYDIAYLRALPKITHMSPKDAKEFEAMIRFGVAYNGPVALRYPRAAAENRDLPMAPIEHGKGELLTDGEDLLIVAYGPMVLTCLDSLKLLAKEKVYPALINARFAKPLDLDLLRRVSWGKRIVVTVEEHALAGGFGSAVTEALMDSGFHGSILRFGVMDEFIEHGSRQELLELVGLTPPRIAERILDCLNETNQARPHTRRRAEIEDQEVL
jgi:1-deoxy-D-xylulose-5-phosphate synthase